MDGTLLLIIFLVTIIYVLFSAFSFVIIYMLSRLFKSWIRLNVVECIYLAFFWPIPFANETVLKRKKNGVI